MFKELCITSDPNFFFYHLAAEKWKRTHVVKYYKYTELVITTQAGKDTTVNRFFLPTSLLFNMEY